MNWLFVTSCYPWPIIHGQWLRVYHLTRTLREQGDSVTILAFQGNEEGRVAYDRLGVEVADEISGSHLRKGRARSPLALYAFDPRMAGAVSRHSCGFDVVLLSHSQMLQYAPEASSAQIVVADIGDDPVLEYGRRRRGPRSLKGWVRGWISKSARVHYERRFLADVQLTTFVSEVDAESFHHRHPQVVAACVPNGVDVDYFQRAQEAPAADCELPTIVFTGHMSNSNNERAADFLVKEVAPAVWRKHPNVRVQIVGADPTDAVRALASERVEVTGRVEDIRPYLWNATVVALPMQSGTGIKNKLLEAWAAGAAVVATPLACQGITARDGENLRIGNSAEEVAGNLVELLQDVGQRTRLAHAGRETVEQLFTWDAAANRLRQAVLTQQSPGGAAADHAGQE